MMLASPVARIVCLAAVIIAFVVAVIIVLRRGASKPNRELAAPMPLEGVMQALNASGLFRFERNHRGNQTQTGLYGLDRMFTHLPTHTRVQLIQSRPLVLRVPEHPAQIAADARKVAGPLGVWIEVVAAKK